MIVLNRKHYRPEQLKKIYDAVLADYGFNVSRFYMMGYSMGSRGCLRFATVYPQLVAATSISAGILETAVSRYMRPLPYLQTDTGENCWDILNPNVGAYPCTDPVPTTLDLALRFTQIPVRISSSPYDGTATRADVEITCATIQSFGGSCTIIPNEAANHNAMAGVGADIASLTWLLQYTKASATPGTFGNLPISFMDGNGNGVSYLGCFVDNRDYKRLLPIFAGAFLANDPIVCSRACNALNYRFSGVEYSTECFCSNTKPGIAYAAPESDCYRPCPGNSQFFCGQNDRLSVYQTTTVGTTGSPLAITHADNTVATWLGCFTDATDMRLLPDAVHQLPPQLPMTPLICSTRCASLGYAVSGTEWSIECYCGTYLPSRATPSDDCFMPCAGDSKLICGGGLAVTVCQ